MYLIYQLIIKSSILGWIELILSGEPHLRQNQKSTSPTVSTVTITISQYIIEIGVVFRNLSRGGDACNKN